MWSKSWYTLLFMILSSFLLSIASAKNKEKDRTCRNKNYEWGCNIIKEKFKEYKIDLIFEVGSRDLCDGNFLAEIFNSNVYSFDANPNNYKTMLRNNVDTRVKFWKSAISTTDGFISFYPYNVSLYNNPGASSLYLTDFAGRGKGDRDFNRSQVQNEIKVRSTRLDTFINKVGHRAPSLLCMDVQESEIEVIRSAGKFIQKIKFVITEADADGFALYKGGATISNITSFMLQIGFEVKAFKHEHQITSFIPLNNKGGDIIFVNTKI
jgi:FkbM family methyltransferase